MIYLYDEAHAPVPRASTVCKLLIGYYIVAMGGLLLPVAVQWLSTTALT